MQELMSDDGEHVIFRVAVRLDRTGNGSDDLKWVDWDHGFVTDKIPRDVRWKDASAGIPNESFRPFTAIGECWQTTGIHGTFVRDEAVALANILAEAVPDFEYRVDRVEISQKRTTEVKVERMNRVVKCPNNPRHRRFMTTAHITEVWIVDERGEYIEALEGDKEVTHGPDPGNNWTCYECNEQATIVD